MAVRERSEQGNTLSEYNKIYSHLKSGQFNPVYLLEGEEGYYIDLLLDFFENQILTEEEKDFNLIVLYGKDSEWAQVVNACTRFPMFAQHTIVILREAMQMRDLQKLATYISAPSASTIFVIDHRGGEISATKKTKAKKGEIKEPDLHEALQKHAVVFKSRKLDETQIPQWVQHFMGMQGVKVATEQAQAIANFLGNNLQTIANEMEKLRINEPNLNELTPEIMEKQIGLSRDYNIFDLPAVILNNDRPRLANMLAFFVANPKSAPMPPLLATFYSMLDKIYRCHSVPNDYNNPESRPLYYFRSYAERLSPSVLHQLFAVLNDIALKSVGIDSSLKDGALLKELVGKMNALLPHQQKQTI